jgi:hypothetical protein
MSDVEKLPVSLCLLVGSLGISFDKCRFCRVYLFVTRFLICYVLCIFLHTAIFICVSGKSFVTFLISLPLYVKVTHLFSGAENHCMHFVFVGQDFF